MGAPVGTVPGVSAPSRRRVLQAAAGLPALAALAAACSDRGGSPTTARGELPDPAGVLVTRWLTDEWSRGSYTFLPPGASPSDREVLAEPLGRLVLAGEATSVDHPATVHGALLSGRRAAAQVRAAAPTGGAVAVVGAGAAGLAAASELAPTHRVVVLEARGRTGGRVWTDRSLGYPVELGAGWIHGPEGNPLVELARRAGVTTVPMRWDAARAVAADGSDVDPTDDEERLATAVDDAAARAEGLDEDAPLSTVLDEVMADRGWDEDERAGLDRAVVTEIDGEFGAGPDELSAWWWDEGSPFAGEDLLVTGGYDKILAPLADGLDIRLSMPVREVRWSDTGASLLLDDGSIEADAVVVTVPAAVLLAGAPRFDPPLPASTAGSLARLGTGLLDKVVLGFTDRAPTEDWVLQWRGGDRGDFAEWVDLQAAAGLPAIVAFNAADAARRWEARSDAEIERAALDVLRTITPT